MNRTIDCLFIGHNEISLEEYEKKIRVMGLHSGAYRDLNLNFIWYDHRPFGASEIYNLFARKCQDRSSSGTDNILRVGRTFSPAIAYLGTYLHRRGFTIDYVNAFQEEREELAAKLAKENILAIAIITTLYVSVLPILEIVEFIRKHNRTAKIIIGGPFISTQVRTQAPETIQYLFRDTIGADIYVNSSQGEATLVRLINGLKQRLPLDQIHNIYYKKGGDYEATPISEEDNRLSENMVDWDLFAHRVGEIVNIRTSISCPFSCAFCGFPQHAGKYQTLGVAKIEEEINRLARIEKIQSVCFIDDTLNVPVGRFKDILNMMIRNRYPFKWHANFRCQFADREMVELMKESGCEGVFLGIESANDQILKNMNKAVDVKQYRRGISIIKEYGITTFGSFIIGFPGETEETARDTFRFIEESGLDFFRVQTWYCEPITPIWQQREKYNIKGESFEWSHTTMDSRTACRLVEEIFMSVKNPIWVPQHQFDFENLYHLMRLGLGIGQVKEFLNGFNNGIREKLKNPEQKEVSVDVVTYLKSSCGSNGKAPEGTRPGRKRVLDSENLLLTASQYLKQKEYWANTLSGEIRGTEFLYHSPESPRTSGEVEKIAICLNQHLYRQLMNLSNRSDFSLYIILLAGLKALIYRYTSRDDIMVISPLYEPDVTEETLNDYLLIRDGIEDRMTFKELLLRIRQSVLDAYENQDYPFTKLVEYLANVSSLPIRHFDTDVVCLLKSIHDDSIVPRLTGKLVFSFEIENDNVRGDILYPSAFYESFLIKKAAQHLVGLLEHSVRNVNAEISGIPLLSEDEQVQLLHEFNHDDIVYPGDKTIHQLFERQVTLSSDSIAMVYDEAQVTYGGVNKRANQLARLLRQDGIDSDSVVAVFLERSLELIIGIMGVLKAGGAYLPIDQDCPSGRITYIIEDSEANVLISREALTKRLNPIESVSLVGMESENIYHKDAANPGNFNSPDSLAYIIYTSGSTGSPKGAVIDHRNVVGYTHAFIREFTPTPKDTMIQQASPSFDAFVEEVFPVLFRGGKILIVQREDMMDIQLATQIINRYQATMISCSPMMLNLFNRPDGTGGSLRLFISGGDVLKGEYIRDLLGFPEVYNTYGPTETTVCAAYYRCSHHSESDVPIGKPVANYQLHILDRYDRLLPLGAAGELCIAGVGVARGYLNRPELTAERFKPDPFAANRVLYRSGDLARWLPDGNLEFLGRIDQQVQLRGFRIEPKEVEGALLRHPDIREGVVVAREDEEGDKYLVAFMTSEKQLLESKVREFLSRELPHYMVPAYFVQVAEIPLTLHGKVNREMLSAIELEKIQMRTAGTELPRNQRETELAGVWSEVLGIGRDKIGIDDNFFELGGHSLKATVLVSKVHEKLNIKIPLIEIFKTPTIRGVSEYINGSTEEKHHYIEIAEKKEYYPLSSAQKRLLVLQQMNPRTTAYNIPQLMTLERQFDRDRLEETLKRLIRRHDSFRTVFEIIDEQPVQRIYQTVDFTVEHTAVKHFVRPFDLARPPLLRVSLISGEQNQYYFMVDMHHIIADGISMDILLEEFSALYEGEELPSLKLQYKDYSEWQNSACQRKRIRQQETYWLREFAGEIPVLNMPTDYPRPDVKSIEGHTTVFNIDCKETERLKAIASREGTTLYMVVLAVYYVFLSKMSGQEDIIVGSPTAGRGHVDLEGMIGMFVNTLALRNYPAKSCTFKRFLKNVTERTLEAFENQDFQFEDLKDKIQINADTGRNPVFDVFFQFIETQTQLGDLFKMKETPAAGAQRYGYQNRTAKFDLYLFGCLREEHLAFYIEYCTSLFKIETIDMFITNFKSIVSQVVQNPDITIRDVNSAHGLYDRQLSIPQTEFVFGD